MKFKFNYKYYLRGTFVILLILVVILASSIAIAINGSEEVKKIYLWVFVSFSVCLIIAYWIYGFVREYKMFKHEKNLQHLDLGEKYDRK